MPFPSPFFPFSFSLVGPFPIKWGQRGCVAEMGECLPSLPFSAATASVLSWYQFISLRTPIRSPKRTERTPLSLSGAIFVNSCSVHVADAIVCSREKIGYNPPGDKPPVDYPLAKTFLWRDNWLFCVCFFLISCIFYIENWWIKGPTLLCANETLKVWKWRLKVC